MYNTQTTIDYHDNKSYRECLRKVTKMNIENLNIPWDQMDDDLDDETKDELLFDSVAITSCMDYIYEKTKNNNQFNELYLLAASKMFSQDPNIGLAILFSYDYFSMFHPCLVEFFNNSFCDKSSYYLKLQNKIS